jgi:hypothetical protein
VPLHGAVHFAAGGQMVKLAQAPQRGERFVAPAGCRLFSAASSRFVVLPIADTTTRAAGPAGTLTIPRRA